MIKAGEQGPLEILANLVDRLGGLEPQSTMDIT